MVISEKENNIQPVRMSTDVLGIVDFYILKPVHQPRIQRQTETYCLILSGHYRTPLISDPINSHSLKFLS